MRQHFLFVCLFLAGTASLTGQTSQEKALSMLHQHLQASLETHGLSQSDWQFAEVSDFYTSRHNNVTHLYLRQVQGGIPLRGAILTSAIWQGKIVRMEHRFLSNLSSRVNSPQPALAPETALNLAASYLQLSDYEAISLLERAQGPRQSTSYSVPGLSHEPVNLALSWIEAPNGSVRLAWEVRIYTIDHQHWWGVWVDAQNGDILGQEDWVIHCSFGDHGHGQHEHTFRLASSDNDEPLSLYAPFKPMATPEYRVFPFPVESPNHGVRALVTDPSNAVASPFGWHDVDGITGEDFTITRGNNVWAQDDRNGDNGTGVSPDGGPSLSFDFPFPSGVAPLVYLSASTTNLFYWNNLMHDVWYQYGFDEVSGNFQANNYGRGGAQGDFVFADAQDGAGLNNANFATPPDGNSGRMQMFLWTSGGSSPDILTVNSPATIAGVYGATGAQFGPGVPTIPLTADLWLALDTQNSNEGCSTIQQPDSVAGRIAVVTRGGCNFVTKVKFCQDAGAVGVIVVQNTGGAPFNMGGADPTIVIPSIMISQTLGNSIKAALTTSKVNVTIFDAGNPNDRDGSFDNGVVAHEYGHGISTRLTGGPAISCLFNQEQAGEGWSDFFSLVMTAEPGDQGSDLRGIGTFAFGEDPSGNGIRDYPYSTDMALSPYTYDDIKVFSIPHGVGSVMCAMLWDLYWKMTETYGFDPDIYNGTGGNNKAMQLVIDGMKLQPCAPGFTDVRDAILLADQINYGGENQCLIWEVFARRGLGFSASQGDPDDRSDGVEGYDLPPSCQEILYLEKTTASESVEQGGSLLYRFTLSNLKDSLLTSVVIRDTLPEPLVYVDQSATCPVTVSGNVVTMTVDTINAGQTLICEFQARVPANASASSFTFNDNLEGPVTSYLVASQTGTDGWSLDTINPRSGQYAWFVPNAEATNDQTLTLPLAPVLSPSILSFWHEYRTEGGWDGGIVEILPTQTGGQWIDAGPYMVANGYNTTLGANNPAGNVDAFSGISQGYIQTKIDLSSFLGQPLFIRFRFLSDDNTALDGWWIDDLRIGTEVSFSNSACADAATGDRFCSEQRIPTLILEGDTSSTLRIEGLANPFQVTVAPNPADEQVNVSWTLSSPSALTLSLRNLLGQEVMQRIVPAGVQEETLLLDSLSPGVYLLELSNGKARSYLRLVVE